MYVAHELHGTPKEYSGFFRPPSWTKPRGILCWIQKRTLKPTPRKQTMIYRDVCVYFSRQGGPGPRPSRFSSSLKSRTSQDGRLISTTSATAVPTRPVHNMKPSCPNEIEHASDRYHSSLLLPLLLPRLLSLLLPLTPPLTLLLPLLVCLSFYR